MDAFSKDDEEVRSNSRMDEAVGIEIIAMQTVVAKDLVKEVMVDIGVIDSNISSSF